MIKIKKKSNHNISKFLSSILGNDETEYTKKWIARFTSVVLLLLLFCIVLVLMLLVFHLKYGLSYRMCKTFLHYYFGFSKILVTGYSVTYISYMCKAYLGKKNEETSKK